MKKSSIIWLVIIVVIVIAGGYLWWSSMASTSQTPAATTQTPAATTPIAPATSPATNPATPPAAPVFDLTLSNSGGGVFGAYLSGANGMTLYQYTKDANNVSNCTGACATAWPPYIVSAAVAAAPTADPSIDGKIGSIHRADGSIQLTYRGLPLYYFAGDAKAGDTKGEAVNGFTEVAP